MVGESIMIAPVYEQNAKGRYVYLPERMKLVRFRGPEDRKEEVLEKGHHYVDIAWMRWFSLSGRTICSACQRAEAVEKVDFDHLGLLGFVEKEGPMSCMMTTDTAGIMNRLPTIRRLLWTQREG